MSRTSFLQQPRGAEDRGFAFVADVVERHRGRIGGLVVVTALLYCMSNFNTLLTIQHVLIAWLMMNISTF